MNLITDDISSWCGSLEDFKPDYTPIKVWSPVQCYRLIGKRTVIELDNFEPIPDLHYTVFSPAEEKYYFREFPDIPLWLMVFYKTDQDWDSYDAFLNSFRLYINDGNVHLLLNSEQIADTTDKLEKLWKANLKGEGKLDYRLYIKIVEKCLQYEDYRDKAKSFTGYKTVCNQFETQIAELWKQASNKQNDGKQR
jgi:hypothetical protein